MAVITGSRHAPGWSDASVRRADPALLRVLVSNGAHARANLNQSAAGSCRPEAGLWNSPSLGSVTPPRRNQRLADATESTALTEPADG
jgi:hypothetical protein